MYSGLGRDWVDTAMAIGVVALLVILVWFGIKEVDGPGRASPGDKQIESAAGDPRATPAGEPDGAPSVLVIRRRLAPEETAVFECVKDGHRTISDQPCGPDAVARIIDIRELSTYTQVPIAPVDMRRHRPHSAASSISKPAYSPRRTPGTTSRCDAIQEEIDAINARMRRPYLKWEGERLRERWHQLKVEYYDESCGKLNLPAP